VALDELPGVVLVDRRRHRDPFVGPIEKFDPT
jgi:hypothetical protein